VDRWRFPSKFCSFLWFRDITQIEKHGHSIYITIYAYNDGIWEVPFCSLLNPTSSDRLIVQSSWNVMAHGDAREGKWRGNWRMEWVASTLHTTSGHGVSSITTTDANTSAASSRLNWPPTHRRLQWTRPFRWKTKSGFCACVITFQTESTTDLSSTLSPLSTKIKAYFL
jgi:hypothetical protein